MEYSSDRHFTAWQYTVAHHSRILLRSPRRTASDTRIDLHVGGVSALLIRPSYRGITVRGGTDEEKERVTEILGPQVFARGERLHVIGEDRMTGFIAGGPLEHRETRAADSEPSGFLPMPPTE
ncbi:hypothetical protein [Streptomyces sp. XY152]|uniref:hypothetical protein n=1 Tax=Streptomyces sp. XY152 TaxID=1415560 RepID=UPI0006AE5241|nr:hypothetical protein [Streptomyces sp. XY152]KOV26566.1 hypothetical protein ADK58_15050 [Streptomyces sp. XY152]